MNYPKKHLAIIGCASMIVAALCLTGCQGYSNDNLYDASIETVYLEMFENRSFRRGAEYILTDALAKRIEVSTPYKIAAKDTAGTVLTGQIISIDESSLSTERNVGRSLENQLTITAVVNWKNLQTGRLLLENQQISASSTYSHWQDQGTEYANRLAANILAAKIVQMMEKTW